MSLFKNFLTKFSVLLFAVLAVSIANIKPLLAQEGGGDCCTQTASNTKGILTTINTFPDIYALFLKQLQKLTNPDDGSAEAEDGSKIESPTPDLVANFGQYDDALLKNNAAVTDLAPEFARMVLEDPDPNNTDPDRFYGKKLPNLNELSYATYAGKPLLPLDKSKGEELDKVVKKYLANLAGSNVYHLSPKAPGNWAGTKESYAAYERYFNTVMAAESYNSHIISEMYANFQDKDQLNTLQTKLVEQAKDPDKWFTQVGSEPIAFVMRQMLLYLSQVFVVQTEMLKTQKEMLYTQAVTNSLLTLIGQYTENNLLRNARTG